MRYEQFIKKLDLPSGFEAPTRLSYQDLVAEALTRAHTTVWPSASTPS